jgi:hypothetical protein
MHSCLEVFIARPLIRGPRALKRLLCGVHAVAVLGSALIGPSLNRSSARRATEGVSYDVSSSFSLLLFFITSRL